MTVIEMNHTHIEQFKERFEEINSCSNERIRSLRLEALITDIESTFAIPKTNPIRIAAFKKGYPDVVSLHKKVSEAWWS